MASTVEGCTAMMRALAPELEPRRLESLEELAVGVAWLDGAEPLVRARVEEVIALFPRARPVDFPFPDEAESAVFRREVADVHRDLFAEHADSYGDTIRRKIERCLETSDAEYQRGLESLARYREQGAEALRDLDLLVTPTLAFVAPPADVDERTIREDTIRRTYPFDALGWPALALPCGAAEDGLPASAQLVGGRGDDALVLAAGELVASLLRGTTQG
jgi:aspartyl-tRNA(Asn)/glutamyl-tRNA(Gln) amidotransferase subunit A